MLAAGQTNTPHAAAALAELCLNQENEISPFSGRPRALHRLQRKPSRHRG
jgi:hypothetical protein